MLCFASKQLPPQKCKSMSDPRLKKKAEVHSKTCQSQVWRLVRKYVEQGIDLNNLTCTDRWEKT